MTEVPDVTVKPSTKAATSALVVTVTLRVPGAAPKSMFSTAVALVSELTVSEATVIPAPELAGDRYRQVLLPLLPAIRIDLGDDRSAHDREAVRQCRDLRVGRQCDGARPRRRRRIDVEHRCRARRRVDRERSHRDPGPETG